MKISIKYSQEIVDSLKMIINQDINYMSDACVIVASTDKDRIGNYHGGAKIVFETNKPLIISYKDEFEGVLPGINLPVFYEGEIVGVIGITGAEEEVGKYGQIIQKMTEILIKEAALKTDEHKKMEMQRFIIEEIIGGRASLETLDSHASFLNAISGKLCIMLVNVVDLNENRAFEKYEEVLEIIQRKIVRDGISMISGSKIISIMNYSNRPAIITEIQTLRSFIRNVMNLDLQFSFGLQYGNLLEMDKSFEEAKKATKAIKYSKNIGVAFYDELDLEILFSEIMQSTKERYIQTVFKDLDEETIEEYVDLVESYVKCNGSIKQASNELFIHKNTMQYRLNKIYTETGHNPRELRDLINIYIAILLMND